MQGIELTNPLLQAQQEDAQRSGTESYFSEYSGFRSIKGKWVFTSSFASNILQATYMGMCKVLDSSDPYDQLTKYFVIELVLPSAAYPTAL